jgi:hypothetical protein
VLSKPPQCLATNQSFSFPLIAGVNTGKEVYTEDNQIRITTAISTSARTTVMPPLSPTSLRPLPKIHIPITQDHEQLSPLHQNNKSYHRSNIDTMLPCITENQGPGNVSEQYQSGRNMIHRGM